MRSCSSLFSAIEAQEGGEADGAGTNGTSANGTSQAPTPTALYGGLRDSLGGLGHLMLKDSIALALTLTLALTLSLTLP